MMQGYKTYVGIAIAVIPTIAQLFGFHVAPGFDDQVNSLVDSIVQLVGLGFALYGRLVATVPGLLVKNSQE